MKQLFFLFLIASATGLRAQSLADATYWFNKYEYAKAAQLYQSLNQNGQLSGEDYQRLVYSFYVIGDYRACQPYADSLVKRPGIPTYFYRVHGEVCFANGRYQDAKESLTKYLATDKKPEDVSLILQACDAIPSWKEVTYLENVDFGVNSSKADISYNEFDGQVVVCKEMGMDSSGVVVAGNELDDAELVMNRPFFMEPDGTLTPILITDSIGNVSIPSLTFITGSDQVLLTLSKPLSEKEEDLALHLYTGRYNKSELRIDHIQPWAYSGYEDSASTAYGAMNASGNQLVFTKIGPHTKGADLYQSLRNADGSWSQPIELTNLNTAGDELFPLFMGDSLLTYSSNGVVGYGGLDILKTRTQGTAFLQPEHVKAPLNGPADDFNLYYFCADSMLYSSNRFGGKGDDDIYKMVIRRPLPPEPVAPVEPFVEKWEPPMIYFDFDKFNLRRDVPNLDELVAHVRSNPGTVIHLEGHADKRGSENYNMWLGLKRAKSVKAELLDMGIAEGQIEVSSKGKGQPLQNCTEGCSEEEHAKNRVVVIYLDKKH